MDCRRVCLTLAASMFCCALALPAGAQPRMPPIPADKMTDAQKKAAEAFATGRGYQIRGPFVPLLRSPEVMLRSTHLSDYLRFQSPVSAKIKEVVILVTAREWTQNYEWQAHAPLAIKAGLNPDIVAAIADGRHPTGMAEDEEAAYSLATEIHRGKRVSDATYRRAVAAFGEAGVIDLIAINGYYTMLAMVLNTARAALPEGAKEQLKRFPD